MTLRPHFGRPDETPKKLRKHFSKNRSELVETKLMPKQCHTIRYNTVPGKAMLKYSGKEGAFMRQDGERFLTWKNSLEKKVNTKTLHPVEIIRKYIDKDEIDYLCTIINYYFIYITMC